MQICQGHFSYVIGHFHVGKGHYLEAWHIVATTLEKQFFAIVIGIYAF